MTEVLSAVAGADELAAARDHAAEARDWRAEVRDEVANARDAAARARDNAAEATGDRSAFGPHLSAPGCVSDSSRRLHPAAGAGSARAPALVSDRTRAAWDRTEAMGDRAESAGDRRAASADRNASASDRAVASLDDLTGAYRRGAGFLELEREVARVRRTGQGLVLAFVDVNGLKIVNDSRGHSAGDRMLRELVATLRTKLRSYDLIIRFGGDEFLCAIPGVTMEEAAERLASVDACLAASPEHGSVTAGLAALRPDDSLAELIARADEALYQRRHERGVVDLTSRGALSASASASASASVTEPSITP